MSRRSSPHVVVILGGTSSEREVSLVSGQQCAAALESEGYLVTRIDAGPDLPGQLQKTEPDVVFNALHGRWGEDGCVQGMLEWLEIPYTHSGVLASSIAMDKQMSKIVYKEAGLHSPKSAPITLNGSCLELPFAPPFVIKPVNEGSSVGVRIVESGQSIPRSPDDTSFERLMIEEYIPGRELTVSVLGDRPLSVTEIITNKWYDYSAKYDDGGSTHVVPADIPENVFDTAMEWALAAHRSIGCSGLTRSDFRWNDSKGIEGLALLETNTQPGMTPTSLSPEQAMTQGISLPRLCEMLIEDALCRS